MFVINASVPDYAAHIHVPTRLVIGCADQAHGVQEMLRAYGIDGEVIEVDTVPERSKDEQERAGRLMALLYAPAEGSA